MLILLLSRLTVKLFLSHIDYIDGTSVPIDTSPPYPAQNPAIKGLQGFAYHRFKPRFAGLSRRFPFRENRDP